MTSFDHASASAVPPSSADATYAKVTLRLVPFLFICYVAAYLDRVNVGFAKLQMLSDLKFSESVYGLGAGIFFVGYFFFEVPSNLMLHRFGARKWIARIMLSWGVISGCMMFVHSPMSFYVLRFFLGVAEAGFFPGIILYLTYWYPASRRSKVTSLFVTGIPMAGVIGGPLSGWLLSSFDGVAGLAGWKWLYLVEAVPSLILGFVTLAYLDDRISTAKWLGAGEKAILERDLAGDLDHIEGHSASAAFGSAKVWILSLAYFGTIMGLYGIGFWLPSLIKASGVTSSVTIGWLVAIPYAATVVSMIVVSRSSDRRRERRWHAALPSLIGAAGLVASTLVPQTTPWAIVTLSVATAGIITGLSQFWVLPPAFLAGAAAAAGIALINSVGNLAGFVSPFIVGMIKDATGSTDAGLYVIAASLVITALIVLSFRKATVDR
jgi:MFS family permease